MEFSLTKLANRASRKLNFSIISHQKYRQLKGYSEAHRELTFLKSYPSNIAVQILDNAKNSKSQIRQDLFTLAECKFKRNGFFVEFGATNGVSLSNSHMMEKYFGWKGILAEPGRNWHQDLKSNRTAIIDTRCVWSQTGDTLQFEQYTDPELSTLRDFKDSDFQKESRKLQDTYTVETVSLGDLLQQHNAPRTIDYLSIDTEGSELQILEGFDFRSHSFSIITCEHNHAPNREKIYKLLTSHGYIRKFESISMFDDWYVKL
jgi:FkbM family methyltransferase